MGLEKNKADAAKSNKTAPAAAAPPKDKGKGKGADGPGRGRKSGYAGKRIYIKAKENPYRKDSNRFNNFKLIKEGMTYEDYVKKGGDSFNLKFGIGKGHYAVK